MTTPDTNPMQEDIVSTDMPTTDEVTDTDTVFDNFFDDLEETPEEEETEVETTETSEEETEEAEETSEEEEGVSEEATDEEYELLSYDDAKEQNIHIELGGKHYSANDLKSLVGQVNSAQTLRDEVEAQKVELTSKTEEIAKQQEWITQQANSVEAMREVSIYDEYLKNLTSEYNDLLSNNDPESAAQALQIKHQMDAASKDRAEQVQKIQATQQQAMQERMQKANDTLMKTPYGAVLQDKQRTEAFGKFMKEQLPAEVQQAVLLYPELFALVEDARLHRKAKSVTPKKNIRTQKVLKSGASKPKTSPKKTYTNEHEAAMAALKDF